MEKSPIFEKIYNDYLSQLVQLNFTEMEKILGIHVEGDGVMIPLFRKGFRVSPNGVFDDKGNQPLHAVSVLLCRYLILCPDKEPVDGNEWVSYKDFKDATPFVGGFVNNTEKAIAKNFTGQVGLLEQSCHSLGGFHKNDGLSYDLSMQIYPLPKIPLYLLFNDADEEFPAECRVLFKKRAEKYLDMECLAIIGWLFTDYLIQVSGKDRSTIM